MSHLRYAFLHFFFLTYQFHIFHIFSIFYMGLTIYIRVFFHKLKKLIFLHVNYIRSDMTGFFLHVNLNFHM